VVSLPFHPAEKSKALLEAPSLKDREQMLVNLLQLGAGATRFNRRKRPPRTLN